MSNSPLAVFTKVSPNCNKRTAKIDGVAIHCMAGDMTIESCGNWFAQSTTQASSNYGVGSDGRIGLYVPEDYRSWCTSSSKIDQRCITIEVASKSSHPYSVTDAAYEGLIKLLVDICERNDIAELKWKGDKSLMHTDSQNMYVHRWMSAKACPGDYLYNLHGDIANRVNALLKKEEDWLEAMTEQEFNTILETKMQSLRDSIQVLSNSVNSMKGISYETIDDIPDWGRPAVQYMLDEGWMSGTGVSADGKVILNVSYDMLRAICILYRSNSASETAKAATPVTTTTTAKTTTAAKKTTTAKVATKTQTVSEK